MKDSTFEILRMGLDGVAQYKHLENEPFALKMVWADQPGFYDADGCYDLTGQYDEDPEYGPYRLVDDSSPFQPDEISLILADGRIYGDTTGRGFSFNDPDFIDLTGHNTGLN